MSDADRPPRASPRGDGQAEEPAPTSAIRGAPGADLGLRQDRGRRLRQGPGRRSGSRSSRPAAPRARCARRGSRSTDVVGVHRQPEILDGRVKTLHPRLHAALLARRDDPEHMATLEREGIEPIDLVCVNLYPFEQTVARRATSTADEAIENIDIGGPTMIRAAAKNHRCVAVVVKPESYDAVLAELEESGGEISAVDPPLARQRGVRPDGPLRRRDQPLVRRRATRTSPSTSRSAYEKFLDLSYGENPHQRAALYAEVGRALARALAGLEAARPGALLQQRPRPRLGAAAARRLRRAGLRDRQAQQPLRGGDRRRRAARPTRRRSPATRCRRSAA